MNLGDLPAALVDYRVVLRPDKDVDQWWAGAPSVVVTPEGTFYLAARMREAHSPRGRRGYEIRILRSTDGIHFSAIRHIRREDAGLAGFERPCLRIDPATNRYKLLCCAPGGEGWEVIGFDDVDHPEAFDPRTVQTVLRAGDAGGVAAHVNDYKDPVVLWAEGQWHLFLIAADKLERIRHFISPDYRTWRPLGADPMMENAGWHNYYTRPASVLPLAVGYLFVYEGSNVNWNDPAYNIATGIGYSPDLRKVIDLTPEKPLLTSATPGEYHTWRYSEWVHWRGRLYVYFEAACPNNTNEIRVAVVEPGEFRGR